MAERMLKFVGTPQAMPEKRAPAVTGEDGRRTVELFTAIYRATREGKFVKFPVNP